MSNMYDHSCYGCSKVLHVRAMTFSDDGLRGYCPGCANWMTPCEGCGEQYQPEDLTSLGDVAICYDCLDAVKVSRE